MELYLTITIIAVVVMGVLGYLMGNRGKQTYVENIGKLENNIAELTHKLAGQESVINEKTNAITALTAERDVQKTNAENLDKQLGTQKEGYEQQLNTQKENFEKQLDMQRGA